MTHDPGLLTRHLVVFGAIGPLIGWCTAAAVYLSLTGGDWTVRFLMIVAAAMLLPAGYVFGAPLGLVTGYVAYRLSGMALAARYTGTVLVGTASAAGVGLLLEGLAFPMLRVMSAAGLGATVGCLLLLQLLERKSPAPVRSGADPDQ